MKPIISLMSLSVLLMTAAFVAKVNSITWGYDPGPLVRGIIVLIWLVMVIGLYLIAQLLTRRNKP